MLGDTVAGGRILIVEDEEIVVRELTEILTSLGYRIAATSSEGDDAIEQAVTLKPDLALIDVVLPGRLDGIMVAERLRSMNIPIVYVSAHADQSLIQRAAPTEPLAYVMKPVRSGEISAVIQLALYRRERELQRDTERQQRTALESAHQKFRVLVDSVTDCSIFALDHEAIILSWNEGAQLIFGYRADQIVGRPFEVLFDAPDRNNSVPQSALSKAREDGSASITRMLRRNGEPYWAEGTLNAIRDRPGVLSGFIVIARDTTAQREMERALLESQERLRVALRAARMGTWHWDIRTDTQTLDESLRGLVGLRPGENIQHIEGFYGLIHPDDRASVRNAFERTRKDGVHLSTEFRVSRQDGTQRWLLDQGEVVRDEHGNPAYLTGAAVDITDRKLTEEALRRSEEHFRLFVNNVRDYALFQMDPIGRIVTWNTGAQRLLGYEEAGILSQPSLVIFTTDDISRGEPEKEMREAAATGRSEDERWHVRQNGTRFWARGVLTAVRDEQGNLYGFAKVMRDETERREVHEKLKASLAEKEVLLKEIHHRVKNNLQVISSLLNLQSERVQHPAARQMFANAVNRVRAIGEIHQLLYRSPDLARVDFCAYLNRLGEMLFSFYGVEAGRICLTIKCDSKDMEIGRAIPCGLIVNELLTNCLKHAFPGDREGKVSVLLGCDENADCILIVADDGIGNPAGITPTSSLGMQLVSVLAKQLQGQLAIKSTDAGTLIEIRFPTSRRREG